MWQAFRGVQCERSHSMGNSASGGFEDTDGKTSSSLRQERREAYEACIAALRAELALERRPAVLR